MDNLSSPTTTPNNTQQVVSETKLALYGVLLVLSLFGNVLVITVVFYNENLRTHFNHLIVNMAISDLFVPLLMIPLKICQYAGLDPTGGWLVGGVLGAILCKLCYFLADIATLVSLFTLVVIALGRFVGIVYPFNLGLGQTLNKKNKYLIALTWLMAMAIQAPYFYYKKHTTKEDGRHECRLTMNGTASDVYLASHIASFFIPLTIITILYSIMIYKLYKRSRDCMKLFDDSLVRRRQRRNRQTFFLSIFIILACAITMGPYYSFLFVRGYIWKWRLPASITRETYLKIHFVVKYMLYFNTAINSCIYFIFVKSFRQGLKNLFGCKKCSIQNKTCTQVARTIARKNTTNKKDDVDEVIPMACLGPDRTQQLISSKD